MLCNYHHLLTEESRLVYLNIKGPGLKCLSRFIFLKDNFPSSSFYCLGIVPSFCWWAVLSHPQELLPLMPNLLLSLFWKCGSQAAKLIWVKYKIRVNWLRIRALWWGKKSLTFSVSTLWCLCWLLTFCLLDYFLRSFVAFRCIFLFQKKYSN